jgi:4-hydroxy-4-methyl-2-oxoglutarate aldolase
LEEPLIPLHIPQLGQLDACTIANAIELFGVRLRNVGFTDSSIHCLFRQLPPMVGYAVTARVRCSNPPHEGVTYFDRTDWWAHILQTPAPRVIVLQDLDKKPGLGSLLGEVHTNILRALGCVGAITNGSVRDLPDIEAMQFPLFAGGVAVSHAYAHFVDFGGEVNIGGLKIKSGELLHGDRHGVISIPNQIAEKLPSVARNFRESERKIIEVCRSSEFSLEALHEAIKAVQAVSHLDDQK